jgi:hypothetical protein
MHFDELNEFQRELLTEAYGAQHAQRLRALIGVPVCAVSSALAAWFFIIADDSGYGGMLGWPIILGLGAVAAWMLFETLAERRVRWAVRSFNLDSTAERQLLSSLRNTPALDEARRRARSEIAGEMREGARRARRHDWWGSRR